MLGFIAFVKFDVAISVCIDSCMYFLFLIAKFDIIFFVFGLFGLALVLLEGSKELVIEVFITWRAFFSYDAALWYLLPLCQCLELLGKGLACIVHVKT